MKFTMRKCTKTLANQGFFNNSLSAKTTTERTSDMIKMGIQKSAAW